MHAWLKSRTTRAGVAAYRRTVRIATFNLLHGQPLRDGRPVPYPADAAEAPLFDAITALDADVLALQEVDRFQERSGHTDQAAVAARALRARDWRFAAALHGRPAPVSGWILHPEEAGAPAAPGRPGLRLYGPGETGEGPGDRPGGDGEGPAPAYGTALISRLPVRDWRARWFPPAPFGLPLRVAGRNGLTRVPDEPRAALAAVIEGPHGPFTAVAAHLSFVPGWNMGQLTAIRRWIADLPAPYLLLGDLNLVGPVPRTVLGGAAMVDTMARRGQSRPGRPAREARTARETREARRRAPNSRVLLGGWQDLARLPTYPSHRPAVQFDHVLAVGVPRTAVRAATAPPTAISDHRPLIVDLAL